MTAQPQDTRIKRIAERLDRLGVKLPPQARAELFAQLRHMNAAELDQWLEKHDTAAP